MYHHDGVLMLPLAVIDGPGAPSLLRSPPQRPATQAGTALTVDSVGLGVDLLVQHSSTMVCTRGLLVRNGVALDFGSNAVGDCGFEPRRV